MYRILVVDDEEMIRSLIRKYAEFEGNQVTEAENGMEAVNLCRQNPDKFDIIIMDVMMPEQSGLTFYGAVCRNEDWKRIPVVMLSAVPISVREHAFATIGLTQGPLPAPAACLEKPCTPEALLEVVNRLVPEPTTA